MRINVRLLIAALGALAVAALTSPANASAASPQAAPWSDPNTKGYIGFCNAANQQIYSGSTKSFPFVAKAVSSVPAPTGYGAKVGRATLYAFQPIQFVSPGDWSGKQMTGATVFSNSAVPMVAGIPADPALANFTAAFPPHWDGFAQLRIYYTAPKATQYSSTYPAAAITISGTTWTQVGGGKVNCAAGQAISAEADLTIANHTQVFGGKPTASGDPSGSPTVSGGAAPSLAAGGATESLSPVAETKKGSGGPGAGIWIGTAIAVAGIATGGVFLRRRRRSDAPLSGAE